MERIGSDLAWIFALLLVCGALTYVFDTIRLILAFIVIWVIGLRDKQKARELLGELDIDLFYR